MGSLFVWTVFSVTEKLSWECRGNLLTYQQYQHLTRGMDWISRLETCWGVAKLVHCSCTSISVEVGRAQTETTFLSAAVAVVTLVFIGPTVMKKHWLLYIRSKFRYCQQTKYCNAVINRKYEQTQKRDASWFFFFFL